MQLFPLKTIFELTLGFFFKKIPLRATLTQNCEEDGHSPAPSRLTYVTRGQTFIQRSKETKTLHLPGERDKEGDAGEGRVDEGDGRRAHCPEK